MYLKKLYEQSYRNLGTLLGLIKRLEKEGTNDMWRSGAICSHRIAENSEKEVKGRQVNRLYFYCNTAGTRVFNILGATLRDSSLSGKSIFAGCLTA